MTKLCGRSRTSPACLECGGCSARGPARWAVRHPQCRCGHSCQHPSSSARQRDAARSTEPGWHPRKLLQASLLAEHGNFWLCGSGWRSTGTQTVTVEGMNVNMLNNTQKNTKKSETEWGPEHSHRINTQGSYIALERRRMMINNNKDPSHLH